MANTKKEDRNIAADTRELSLKKIDSIYAVDGFDPLLLTESYEYTDSSTGEVGKTVVLPARVRVAWFRMVYREGKIVTTVRSEGDGRFVAEAKVYCDRHDPPEDYLANAICSRRVDPKVATNVSPREWAQTAAIGKALCNAGFRLSVEIFSDELNPDLRPTSEGEVGDTSHNAIDAVEENEEQPAVDAPESGDAPAKKRGRPKKDDAEAAAPAPAATEESVAPEKTVASEKPVETELTVEDITPEMFEWAMNLPWKSSPSSKTAVYNGKPMKEMLLTEEGCKILRWASGKTFGEFSKAAKILCLKAQG